MAAGAWSQRGAAANPQHLNRYSYVLNSPLNHTDPTGHINKPEPSGGLPSGGAGGGRPRGGGGAGAGAGGAVSAVTTAACADNDCGNEVSAVATVVEAEVTNVLAPYSQNQGHHIIAASNVVPATQRAGNAFVNKMLTVADEVLESMGVQHRGPDSLTSIQNSLLRNFAKSGELNTWQAQRTIAQEALQKAGIDSAVATAWATKAYEQVVSLFPNGPPRTPFGK